MKKIIISSASLVTVAASIATVVSCGASDNLRNDLPSHEYIFDASIQDSSTNKHVTLNNINRQTIETLPANINAHFGSRLISGGYGEVRHYYGENNQGGTPSYHLGIDSMVPSGTKVLSPVNGEIINAFWEGNTDGHKTFAEGAGGMVSILTPIKDLNIPQENKEMLYFEYSSGGNPTVFTAPKFLFIHNGVLDLKNIIHDKSGGRKTIKKVDKSVYDAFLSTYDPTAQRMPKANYIKYSNSVVLSFMHLSKSSISLFGITDSSVVGTKNVISSHDIVANRQSRSIKKGEQIGYVGTMSENGGWATHVHSEVVLPLPISTARLRQSRLESWETGKSHSVFTIKATGTYSHSAVSNYESFETWSEFSGIVDPNNIYQLYDNKTPIVSF